MSICIAGSGNALEYGTMVSFLLTTLGGVGIFLVGMVLMTEGLRALAGDSIRKIIKQATDDPYSGATTGALVTALLQSSSATTVAAVGFVSAGLMTFPQALGIIFGANIGTTITGWLVAVVGFKLKLGSLALPLVFLGMLLRLFGRRTLQQVGWAVAGFGLLFVGISAMQAGMESMRDIVSPTSFPSDSISGRFLMVLLGIAITIVTQSSSAGVAIALAALGAGTITFTQAAALVIGMDVGTTFTAALATLGGNVATRRTGFAHVIYNLMTGVMAFLLLIPISWHIKTTGGFFIFADPQLSLVAFHTAFNLLGVLVVIGFTHQFANLMFALVPDRGNKLTGRLDEHFISVPASACDALNATISDIATEQLQVLQLVLQNVENHPTDQEQEAIRDGLDTAKKYADSIGVGANDDHIQKRLIAGVHALDHLYRLHFRSGQHERLMRLRTDPKLVPLVKELTNAISEYVANKDLSKSESQFDALRKFYRNKREEFREEIIKVTTSTSEEIDVAFQSTDSIRWLHRASYHVWRIFYHLQRGLQEEPYTADSNDHELDYPHD